MNVRAQRILGLVGFGIGVLCLTAGLVALGLTLMLLGAFENLDPK